MNVRSQASIPVKSYPPEWLPTLTQASGFLFESLEANRAGLYSGAQKLALKARGRREFHQSVRPAWGAIGVSLLGFLSALFLSALPKSPLPGIVSGPEPWVRTAAKLLSLILLCIGLLVLGTSLRRQRMLRKELEGDRIAVLQGPMTSRSDFAYSDDPAARTSYHVEISGVSFEVDGKAYTALQRGPSGCAVRAYYLPSRMWLVNLEPASEVFAEPQ